MKETIERLSWKIRWVKDYKGCGAEFAIQEGRLFPLAWKVLETAMDAAGIELPKNSLEKWDESGSLVFASPVLPRFKIFKTKDASLCVSRGFADYAITGSDELSEQNLKGIGNERYSRPYVFDAFDEGRTSLVIQVPQESGIQTEEGLADKTLASKYPATTDEYLRIRKVQLREIIPVRGKVEAFANPQLGAVDAVADLVETGTTMRLNGLRPLVKVADFRPVFIGKTPLPDRAAWPD